MEAVVVRLEVDNLIMVDMKVVGGGGSYHGKGRSW